MGGAAGSNARQAITLPPSPWTPEGRPSGTTTWAEFLWAYVDATLGRAVWPVAALPGIVYIALAVWWARPRWPGLALVLGVGAQMSILPASLLVPVLLLRPRRRPGYEDMPRSALAAVLAAPVALLAGNAAALLQCARGHEGSDVARAAWTAWASLLCGVLCHGWSIFRDRCVSD